MLTAGFSGAAKATLKDTPFETLCTNFWFKESVDCRVKNGRARVWARTKLTGVPSSAESHYGSTRMVVWVEHTQKDFTATQMKMVNCVGGIQQGSGC